MLEWLHKGSIVGCLFAIAVFCGLMMVMTYRIATVMQQMQVCVR